MAVICVMKHSVTEITLNPIFVYTLGSVHIAVMCAVRRLGTDVF